MLFGVVAPGYARVGVECREMGVNRHAIENQCRLSAVLWGDVQCDNTADVHTLKFTLTQQQSIHCKYVPHTR